jgi:hypothetical protein
MTLPIPLALRKRIKENTAKVRAKKIQPKSHGYTLEDLYRLGGKPILEMVLKYGCNNRGEPIQFTPWLEEVIELQGDFRISDVLTTGCAQLSKTLSNSNILAACLIEFGLNCLWSYDMMASRDIQAKENLATVIKGWLARKDNANRLTIDNTGEIKYNGAISQFVYVRQSSASQKAMTGLAKASGTNVGVSRDILFNEESSQSPPGSRDPLMRRLDAGRLPSQPKRELGTPGAGQGIERLIKQADYNFQPHYKCPHCGVSAPLSPKGCLLKAFQRQSIGVSESAYLSMTGRPAETTNTDGTINYHWFHHDPQKPIDSAYFGCSSCGGELTKEVRENAWFQCVKTGVKVRDLLDSLPPEPLPKRITAGLTISPLLRIQKANTAAKIIRDGLDTDNTEDWQQQALGEESEGISGSLSLTVLNYAIAAKPPNAVPDFVIAGNDQGRQEHWLWINQIFMPPNWRTMPTEKAFEQAVRVCIFAGAIEGEQLNEILTNNGVVYGLTDGEPDIDWAIKVTDQTVLEMADQRKQDDAYKRGEVATGGKKSPCWNIRNSKFLMAVREGFLTTAYDGFVRYRLPDDWERWASQMGSTRNPLRHLSAVSYDRSTGLWVRPQDHIDDLYYAAMFGEAALYLHIESNSRTIEYGTIDEDDRDTWGQR